MKKKPIILSIPLLFLAAVFLSAIILGVSGMQANQPKKQQVIILLGPPGSGKGTQAKDISQEIGIPHISTGDLFRENISNDTELGRKAKSYMNQGKLVPDEIVLDMLYDRVSKEDCKAGYLLDGFPRTIPQAESLGKSLPKDARLIVVNLDVPDEVIIKRISGRLSCKYCGNVHNIYFTAPKEEGKCDRCKRDLYQRDDDKPEVVEERLRVYERQTAQLVDYYDSQKVLHTVDGQMSAKEVNQEILSILGSAGVK